MSLIGRNLAIISLGLSCQPAQQLQWHAQTLSVECGDDFKHVRLPLDWVISSFGDAARWLRSGIAFPDSISDLVPVHGQPGAFLWANKGIYLWHDFVSHGDAMAAIFDHVRQKYETGFVRMRDMRKIERVILVVANTQNNLSAALGSTYKRENFEATSANLIDLKEAADGLIGRHCEMLCLSYDDLAAAEFSGLAEKSISVIKVPRNNLDINDWVGDSELWLSTLKTWVGSQCVTMPFVTAYEADGVPVQETLVVDPNV
jgi:hypothetical protein